VDKDLTSSNLDRQNILNNEFALEEIKKSANIKGIIFEEKITFTKGMIAVFYDVDIRTIERYTTKFSDELKINGYEILKGKRLKHYIYEIELQKVPDINVGKNTPQLAIYDFKAFLNIGMVLVESENARVLSNKSKNRWSDKIYKSKRCRLS